MSKIELYIPTLFKWEGTILENVPGDNGSWTKCGITIFDYKKYGKDHNNDGVIDEKDLNLMPLDEATSIIKLQYWDKFKADQINNQSIAEFLVDFAYNCGVINVIKKVQKILNINADGIFGNNTLGCINAADGQKLFEAIKMIRLKYYNDIINTNPKLEKFRKGWEARVLSFIYKKMINKI